MTHAQATFVVLVCLLAVGCGGKRLVRTSPDESVQAASAPANVPADSLETFMAKVRAMSLEARPRSTSPLTLEASDARLTAAVAAALSRPTSATYRGVAAEYKRLNVFDKAHEYLSRALRLNPEDSATHDALARLWRDARLPHLGLVDAYRAVYYAPDSAVSRNTLGTVLQAMGHRALARDEYERAVKLDPSAAFAFNNLCYVLVLESETSKAVTACERALALEPNLSAARNNLGLAYAVAGRTRDARQAFRATGDDAAALYNTGIVHLARREYRSAVEAFRAAHAVRPTFTAALVRAAQASAAAMQPAE